MGLRHSIGRQVVECRVTGPGVDGHALQERIARLCRDVLPGVLEAAFDRHAPAGAVLRIDALAIDLGDMALAALETELAGRLREKLHEGLAASLRRFAAPDGRAGNDGERGQPAAMDAALLWFLRHGTLPAWYGDAGPGLAGALRAYWREDASTQARAAFVEALRGALDEPGVPSRLLTQFDGPFRRALAERVRGGAAAQLDETLAAILGDAPPSVAGPLRPALEVAALRMVLDGQAPAAQPMAAAALARLPADSAARPLLAAIVHGPSAAQTRGARARRIHGEGGQGAFAPPAPPAAPAAPHPDQATGLAVREAGIVLLHPFLPRLFDTLGIAHGRRLVLPDRALALLHFLATGERQAPEHALALAKVLCGLPLATPADGGIVLDDAQCAEATAMLAAAIGHWSALRNTTPDGLRGAFLVRPGVLREREGDWHLRVQAETADILLDSLPWGVGTVRLPWMTGILWVDWR